MSQNATLRLAGGAGLLAASAVAGWLLVESPVFSSEGPAAASGPRPVPVRLESPSVGTAATLVRATGTLRSSDSVVVQPDIAGRVTALRFQEGQPVAAGAVLVELDRTELDAEVRKARAAVTLSAQNLERVEALARRGSAPGRALDEARAQAERDAADLRLAENRLAKTVVTAPFEGVVALRELSVGRYVEPGDELVRLERIDPLYVDFRIPERWLGAVAPGDRATLIIDAAGVPTVPATIVAIDPLVDVDGRALRLRAAVDNPDLQLRPGLFARVDLELDRREDAILVSESAILLNETGAAVYTVSDGVASLRTVRTGVRRDGRVEIVEGLTPADRVVTAGHVRLRDGAPVTIETASAERS